MKTKKVCYTDEAVRSYHNIGDRHWFVTQDVLSELIMLESKLNKEKWGIFLEALLAISLVNCFVEDINYRGRPVVRLEDVDKALDFYNKLGR